LKHPWIGNVGNEKVEEVDLGKELREGLQSVRQDDKISRVIGKVNAGALSINDLSHNDKKIVYDNVKNHKDVEKYLSIYNKNNVGRAPVAFQQYINYQQPKQQKIGYQSPIFDENAKGIMESIMQFKEQDIKSPDWDAYDSNESDQEYEMTVRKTMDAIKSDLNDQQKNEELKDMLGDDFEEFIQSQQQQNKGKEVEEVKKNEKSSNVSKQLSQRQVTHKNSGNPLNIQCEEDEELAFDEKIVEQLMSLGMATKNACIRAVLATDSKGVNQAAEWLLNHQNDKGINHQVDVL